MNKRFYFKHLLKIAFANKIRLSLTMLGVFIAVLSFFVGNIVSDSFYKNKLKYINAMDEKTMIVNGIENKDDDILNKCQNPIELSKLDEEQTIEVVSIGDDIKIRVNACLCGISNTQNVIIGSDDVGRNLPFKSCLIKGRHINDKDVRNKELVVVINKFTEKTCFMGDAIGKYIELRNENKTVKLLIVGVVEDTINEKKDIVLLKKSITNKASECNITMNIYCPISVIKDKFNNNSKGMYFCNFDNYVDYKDYEEKIIERQSKSDKDEENYIYKTKTELLNGLEQEMNSTKMLIKIALISLSVISGVTIMSVTFFSVKERIPEIGIRKAFGAKKRDILGQFMVEMLIMGVFASIMAVIVGIILCHLIEYFVSKKLFIDFSMYYSVKQFLLPIFIGICEIIGFAVIPSFYAANINVIKSLKFE